MSKVYDVVIVGGGVAGLSAALILGRYLRSVLVFDDGHPRDKASHAAHCLLANEGIAPAELLRRSRRELQNYQHVVAHQRTVDRIHSEQKAFAIFSEGGLAAMSRKVLLTTGLKDKLPDIDGVENYYGRSVHHCPYCDGYDHARQGHHRLWKRGQRRWTGVDDEAVDLRCDPLHRWCVRYAGDADPPRGRQYPNVDGVENRET